MVASDIGRWRMWREPDGPVDVDGILPAVCLEGANCGSDGVIACLVLVRSVVGPGGGKRGLNRSVRPIKNDAPDFVGGILATRCGDFEAVLAMVPSPSATARAGWAQWGF